MVQGHAAVEIPETGIDSLTGGSDAWEEFLRSLKSTFEPILKLKGLEVAARRFQDKVETLVQYGQTLCVCRLAVADAARRYAIELIRLKSEKRYARRLEKEIDNLADKADAANSLKEGWYWGLAGVKCSLWVSLWNYQASFRYWALADGTLPSIAETVPKLCDSVAKKHATRLDTLDAWTSPPQHFGKGRKKIGVEVRDPVTLEGMRRIGSATFAIALDDPGFVRWDRVRVDEVEVKLEGIDMKKLGSVDIMLMSSGVYDDRLDGRSWRFVSRPWTRLLRFEDGLQVTDSRTEDEFRLFAEPTPFSEWTVVILSSDGSYVDLTGLKAIRLEFAGSFIVDMKDRLSLQR